VVPTNNQQEELQKSEKPKPVPTELIQKYYKEIFDSGELLSLIGLSTFYRREFAFLLENDVFIRNISFKSTSELIQYMTKNPVRRSYVGAVYEVPPTKKNTIQKIPWTSREFCFDLDINDYDPVRICGCRGKEQLCDYCWSLVQDATYFLDKSLKEDFGFKDIVWVFSGRRGMHAWVRDPIAGTLTQQQRNSIVNYLSLIKDKKRSQAVEKDLRNVLPLRDRILKIIAKSFFQKAKDKELKASPFNFKNKQIERLRYVLSQEGRPFTRETYDNLLGKKRNRDDIFSYILTHRYPRIDKKVSIDTRRILKIPGGVQDTNGNICCTVDIKEIYDFFPEKAPNIYDYF
jgi:DNA primase small subunit